MNLTQTRVKRLGIFVAVLIVIAVACSHAESAAPGLVTNSMKDMGFEQISKGYFNGGSSGDKPYALWGGSASLSTVHNALAEDLDGTGWRVIGSAANDDARHFYITRPGITECLVVDDYRRDGVRFTRSSIEFRDPSVPSKVGEYATTVLFWPTLGCR